MNKKGYLQISFGWMFAIIAGIFILALAIYISTKFIGIKQTQIDTETAKHIGVLLNPFEIGIESTIHPKPMTTPSETRIHISCNENGVFGNQLISTSMKSLGKWTDESVEVSFKAKYIFSDETVEGKKFFLFFRPFNSPFKVADIIVLTSSEEDYCFVTDISKIKRDVNNIQQENLYTENCPANSVRICFNNVGSGNCDVEVFYDEDTETGYVEKEGERVEYFGNLLYGAIFSDKELYECQVKRLMKRLELVASLYEKKAVFVSQRGCTNNLAGDLSLLASSAGTVTVSDSLNQLILPKSKDIEEKNGNNEYCKLW